MMMGPEPMIITLLISSRLGIHSPFLYFYDNDLNLINKVDITSENIHLFVLAGLSDGSFAGTCSDYGITHSVEYLCYFNSEGERIKKIDISDDIPGDLYYRDVYVTGLSDRRVMVSKYGGDKVWIYGAPAEELNLSSFGVTEISSIEGNPPEELDLSSSGISGIGSIAGNILQGPSCVAERIYGNFSEETELLRNFRDNVLNKTHKGQEIIKLYYKLSPAVVKAMEGDKAFKEEIKAIIDTILPLIKTAIK